jgi:hypothetical protein
MKTYYLQRWKVHALPVRGLMRCHLHGVGHGWWGQLNTHQEFVNIPLREHEPVQETIRRAVAASSHVWKVSLLKNLSVFDGKFYQPVREQTRETENALQEVDKRTIKVARSNV